MTVIGSSRAGLVECSSCHICLPSRSACCPVLGRVQFNSIKQNCFPERLQWRVLDCCYYSCCCCSLLLLLVAVVVVHVVAAYCHKTLRRAPLKDNCQTDMLPTHGLKGETERYRISLSTTPLVCSFCPTPSLFSPLLSLFTPLPFVPVSYLHVSCHALLL